MRSRRFATPRGLVALFVLMLALSLPALAQQGGRFDPMGRSEVRQYQLSESFLHKIEAVTRDGQAMHLKNRLDPSGATSIDELAQRLDKIPEAHQLLQKYGISAHEYLVGSFAMIGAVLTAHMRADPKTAQYVDDSKVNEANVKFYKAHQDEIDRLMQTGSRQPGAAR